MRLLTILLLASACAAIAGCSDDQAPAQSAGTASDPVAVAGPPASPSPATAAVTEPPPAMTPQAVPAPAPQPATPDEAPGAGVLPVPGVAATPVAPAQAGSAAGELAYVVECADGAKAAEQCKVDKDTYVGWRTFAGQCQVCHGGSALGSTFAPNLLDRFHERVDHARFVDVVTNGFRGQVGAMPAWKGNPNVEPHIDAIYRYLKARADGVLPPGRPERKP